MGLSGGLLGAGGSSGHRRRRALAVGGLAVGAALTSGVVGTPLAYHLAGATGLATVGSGLFLSALLPLVLTLVLFQRRELRGLLAGINLGYAALLTHAAVVLPTMLYAVPGGAGADRVFLAANAIVTLGLAFLVSRKR